MSAGIWHPARKAELIKKQHNAGGRPHGAKIELSAHQGIIHNFLLRANYPWTKTNNRLEPGCTDSKGQRETFKHLHSNNAGYTTLLNNKIALQKLCHLSIYLYRNSDVYLRIFQVTTSYTCSLSYTHKPSLLKNFLDVQYSHTFITLKQHSFPFQKIYSNSWKH